MTMVPMSAKGCMYVLNYSKIDPGGWVGQITLKVGSSI